MSEVKVNKVSPRSGTTVTIGDSGDTINLVGTLQNNGSPLAGDISSVVAGTGLSGGATSGVATLNIEAAQPTITSLGTITGFTSTGIDDNADATAITIDSSEQVGIGTSAPSDKLDIYNGGINVDTTGNALLATRYTSGSGANNINLYKSQSATIGTHTALSNSSGIGGIITRASDGTSFINATAIFSQVDGTVSTNSVPSRITFSTNSGSTAYSERMRITSAGNVGIGTSSPSQPLDVLGSAQISYSGANTYLYFQSTSNFIGRKTDGNLNIGVAGSQSIVSSTGGTERMRIDSSGNVGIGTASPASIGSNITTVEITGGSTIRTGGLYLSNSDKSIKGYWYGSNTGFSFGTVSNSDLKFVSNNTERVRITSGGTVLVSNTSEPSSGDNGAQISNGSYHIFCRNNSGSAVFRTFGSAGEFRTIGNGNAQNTNNSYGAISDRVLKENEVDASSQWNDIKALQIKHYNFKLKPNEKQLGVIAQDLEASGMNGLVENNQDELYTEDDILPEGKNIGDVKLKNYKSVKYSILYMKSVKALQEAMERIETLEARITTLENA